MTPTTSARSAEKRLGAAIRAVRRERGLTLVQVAAAAELSQPFLSQVELGRTRASMRSLFRIASALGTTQQALLDRASGGGPVDVDVLGTGGRARLLLHGGADVTEFVGVPREFGEYFAHDRHELLYVVQGTIEVDLGGSLTVLGPRGTTTYDGRVDHRFRQIGELTSVVLLVHSPT